MFEPGDSLVSSTVILVQPKFEQAAEVTLVDNTTASLINNIDPSSHQEVMVEDMTNPYKDNFSRDKEQEKTFATVFYRDY